MPLRPSQIIGAMSPAKFSEMMARSPRQVRETLFNRLQIKSSTTKSVLPKLHQKNEERVRKLHGRLAEMSPTAKNEQELCEELIRNWLVIKTPMLAVTLDHFGVKHQNGLTEQEIDFFERLETAKVEGLLRVLIPKFDAEEVAIYLRFLKVPYLRGRLPAAAYPPDAPAAVTADPDDVAAPAPEAAPPA